MIDDPLQSIDASYCRPFQLYFYLNLFQPLEGSVAATTRNTPRAPKSDSSGNKEYIKEGRKTLNHELVGKVLKGLISRNPRHNERILDAFILENDIVFAE